MHVAGLRSQTATKASFEGEITELNVFASSKESTKRGDDEGQGVNDRRVRRSWSMPLQHSSPAVPHVE
jgi:hypothetical protein